MRFCFQIHVVELCTVVHFFLFSKRALSHTFLFSKTCTVIHFFIIFKNVLELCTVIHSFHFQKRVLSCTFSSFSKTFLSYVLSYTLFIIFKNVFELCTIIHPFHHFQNRLSVLTYFQVGFQGFLSSLDFYKPSSHTNAAGT